MYKILQSFNEITLFLEKLQPQSWNFMNAPRTTLLYPKNVNM